MEKTRMNFFLRIHRSMTDFKFYHNVVHEPLKYAIIYLLLFSLLMGVLSAIMPVYDFNQKVSTITDSFDTEIPDFRFENGRLDIEGNMPIIIQDNHSTIIIDTTDKTDENILDNYDEAILFLSDRMISKANRNSNITTFDYSAIRGFSLEKSDIANLIPLLRLFSIFLVIFIILWFIATKFISALIVSVIGMVINAAISTRIKYKSIFIISVYALTLPIFLKMITSFIPISIGFFGFIYYIIAGFYVWYYLNSVRHDQPQQY